MTNCPAWTSYVNTVELCNTVVGTIFIDGLWSYSEDPSHGYGIITADTNHPSYDVDWFTFYPGDTLYIITDIPTPPPNDILGVYIEESATDTFNYQLDKVPDGIDRYLCSFTFRQGEPPFILKTIHTDRRYPGDFYFTIYDIFSDKGGASISELANPQLMWVSARTN